MTHSPLFGTLLGGFCGGGGGLRFEFEKILLQVTVPKSAKSVFFHFVCRFFGAPTIASHAVESNHVASPIGAPAAMDKDPPARIVVNRPPKALDILGSRESAGLPRYGDVLHAKALDVLSFALGALAPVARIYDDPDAAFLELLKTFLRGLPSAKKMVVDGVKIGQARDLPGGFLSVKRTQGGEQSHNQKNGGSSLALKMPKGVRGGEPFLFSHPFQASFPSFDEISTDRVFQVR